MDVILRSWHDNARRQMQHGRDPPTAPPGELAVRTDPFSFLLFVLETPEGRYSGIVP